MEANEAMITSKRIKSADPLLSINQSAAYVGMKPKTVRNWLWRRLIPSYRIGRSVRIRQSDLQRVIDDGFTPADPELALTVQ